MNTSMTPMLIQLAIMFLAVPVAFSIIEIMKGNMYYWTTLFMLLSGFLALVWFYPEFMSVHLANER